MTQVPLGGDRRQTERNDRRKPGQRPEDESWWGVLGEDGASHLPEETGSDESRVSDNQPVAGPTTMSGTDSRFLARQARRIIGSGQTAFQRLYSAFIAARAALGVALVVTVILAGVFGVPPPVAVTIVSIIYATLALAIWGLPRFRRGAQPRSLARLKSPQWLATIGADITCFTALHVLSPAASLNYGALLVLPVLMAGVLTPRLVALATASIVTLALLLVAGLHVLAGGEMTALMTQAALAGSGFFVITLLAGELSIRLAREEEAARGSLELARQQAQLNRLVIEEMQEGVLVVDRRLHVRAANPSARALLVEEGLSREAPFLLTDAPHWAQLARSVEMSFDNADWPDAGRDIALDFPGNRERMVRVRMRFTRRRSTTSEDLCVLLIEDVRQLQARMRQEKLAAMGRVSAGIAHEIRNPLAAISQANALMAEDASTASARQLTRMVSENVERLKRIVDDVMEVSPGELAEPGAVNATAVAASVCIEWTRTNEVSLSENSILRIELPDDPVGVVFDAEHLRRVLVNLMDNAYRHAEKHAGAIELKLVVVDENRAVLSVASDGEPIPRDVERYLFEPFFSTRSRGTGLGLYICRELCERYGARIDYRLRGGDDPNRNEFFVAMRRRPLPAHETMEATLHLTP